MKKYIKTVFTGTVLLLGGMVMGQTVPSIDAKPINPSPTAVAVNQRGDLHEVSPSGSKVNDKNAQAFYGNAQDMKNGRHHRHHRHHKHHKHHRNITNKPGHSMFGHHKI